MLEEMHIYVFSYNRGVFLDNCLKSIQRCAHSYDVTIIDDHSSETHTIEILNNWKKRYNVLINKNNNDSYKIGGLYRNMNIAMKHAERNNYKYVLFIQDDMQFTRPVLTKDIEIINNYFIESYKHIQYYPCFQKLYQKKNNHCRKLNRNKTVYFKSAQCQYSGFSAVGLFHVKRFLNKFVTFEDRERVMDQIARNKGIFKGEAVYPFISYLPHPVAYRKNKSALIHFLYEKISGAGFYPVEIMEQEAVNKFFKRDPNAIPYAENYLNAPGVKKIPWSFAGGGTALYEQGGWKKVLGRIIKRFDFSLS